MPRSDSYPGSLDQLPSGTWRWRVSIAGERHAETWKPRKVEAERRTDSSGRPIESLQETAERMARSRYDEFSDRLARGEPGETPLARFLTRFEREETSQLADSTQRTYSATTDALRIFFVERGRDPTLRQLGRGDVKRFLAWRRVHASDGSSRSEPLAAATLRREYAVVRRMLEYALDLELIPTNPADRVSPPKPAPRDPVLLTDEQLEDLLEACGEDDMLRLYVLLLAETGVRSKSEGLHIRWEDLDLQAGFLFIPSGRDGHRTKSRRGRHVPLTSRIRAALRDHAAKYRLAVYGGERSPYLFHHVSPVNQWGEPGGRRKSFDTALATAVEEAELPDGWRVHDLRHRRCTRWLAEGYSPEKVRRALGHADLSTTLKYSHLVRSDLEEMVGQDDREALAELGS